MGVGRVEGGTGLDEIKKVFAGFQKYLYQQGAALYFLVGKCHRNTVAENRYLTGKTPINTRNTHFQCLRDFCFLHSCLNQFLDFFLLRHC